MIEELRLENFAGISGEVFFSSGLNVIIGETGAGKSLLLSSINFLKGEKAPSFVENCFVEAVFSSEEEVFVRREVKKGRSRCFLNGMRVPQKVLYETLSPLVVFQSQRQSIELLKPSYQLKVLDTLAGNELLLNEYQKLFKSYTEAVSSLEELEEKIRERDREVDILKFQIGEIKELNLRKGEEEELLKLRSILSQAEKIRELKALTKELLYEGEGSALERLSQVIASLKGLNGGEKLAERLENICYELEDICLDIDRSFQVPEEDISLDEIEERLYKIERIKKKYGSTYEEIMDFLKKAEEKVGLLENLDFEIEKKRKEVLYLKKQLGKVAKELSERRKRAAEELEQFLVLALKELGMEKARFKVEFSKAEPNFWGMDRVEFLFSGNPRLPLTALSSSISGGELSRFLLAVLSKVSVSKATMVFDEIDAGMSGRILSLVALKLKNISKMQQVIAVTHSPQVVAAADKVFKVEKREEGTFIKELQGSDLVEEIAIMISGSLTEKSLEAAEDLLKKWEE